MYDELVKRLRRCEQFRCRECEYENVIGCRAKLNAEAADAIEELRKQVELEYQSGFSDGQIAANRKKPRWIPVTERLPELNTSCLLYNKYYGPMVGARIDDMRFRIPGSRFPDTPTHWMPLPEPQKEEA